ncbi:unnamed protein product [Paramecium pentaurelia]|uniref:CDC20/Fizzy WD40 domain-containing protein n=1 Tax=Paramecium pentaurelia TaxID=43138 RepID=A0A8S1RX32_9CILI|nr:unnamed protein product [Paramecium pentaurelia]
MDRFIPKSKSKLLYQSHTQSNYNDLMYHINEEKVLNFGNGKQQQNFPISFLDQLHNQYRLPQQQIVRQISSIPEKILDAPDIADDFYLNILEWGNNNVLSVGLQNKVYLWNASNQHIEQLLQATSNVTSVHWINDHILGIGFDDASIKIVDVCSSQTITQLYYHNERVSTMSSSFDLLSSSGRDNVIFNHDLREKNNNVVGVFQKHTQEVCGLKWNSSGTTLSSGANDNQLLLWDRRQMSLRQSCQGHCAAVKAMAWCPWLQNTLVSGGGSNDKTIKFWNADTGICFKSIDSGSQVCALQFLPRYRELISSHGFSKFQISIWNADQIQQAKLVQELQAHKSRVLHLGISPDQSMLCSAAGDETLIFWRLGTEQNNQNKQEICSSKNLFLR